MSLPYCGECSFLSHEDIDGFGCCDITRCEQRCSDQCTINRATITDKQAEKILHHFQKWRRGHKGPQPHPYVVGQAIDKAIKTLHNERVDKNQTR